jgi:hypothetical protein
MMKQVQRRRWMRRGAVWVSILITTVLWAGIGAARLLATEPGVLYETGFEADEGFDLTQTVAGQGGWVSINSGGNGLVEEFIEGAGQQAFIGFAPPDDPAEPLFVFHPLNYVPDTSRDSTVRFSTLMAIIDSTYEKYDDFRWSVYNVAGQRLFTLDFDNDSLLISYALDDGAGFISTGTTFSHASLIELVITMNLARNHWTASLNNLVVVNAQPITTTGATLDIGDIDAVWAIRDPEDPGDNFMLFDNYRVSVGETDAIPPAIEWGGRSPDGRATLRIFGEPGRSYAVEGSFDLVNWSVIETNSAPDGIFDFVDNQSPDLALQFYRARLVE